MFTDKLVAKIPSTASGIITEINFGDDDICPVGHVILKIDEEGEEGSSASASSTTPTPETPAAETPISTPASAPTQSSPLSQAGVSLNNAPVVPSGKVLSTPAVRHLARKENIDIAQVQATGKGGRVTKTDIINFIKNGRVPLTTAASTQGSSAASGGHTQRGFKIAPLTGITEQDT